MAGDVGEGRGGLVAVGVEAGSDGGELGAADGVVGLKGTVLIALDDTHLAQGRHGAAEPVAVLHVVVAIALGHVGLAGLVGQQTEEDGSHLGAGNIVLGPHVVVAVADDISVVVLPVQPGRHIIGDLHNRRLGTVTTAATATAGVAEVRGEGVSLTARELLDHFLDGLIVQSSIGADLRIVLRPVGEVVSTTIIGCSGAIGRRHNLFISSSNGQDFHIRGNRTSVRIGADVLDQHLIAVGDTVAAVLTVLTSLACILPVVQIVSNSYFSVFSRHRPCNCDFICGIPRNHGTRHTIFSVFLQLLSMSSCRFATIFVNVLDRQSVGLRSRRLLLFILRIEGDIIVNRIAIAYRLSTSFIQIPTAECISRLIWHFREGH